MPENLDEISSGRFWLGEMGEDLSDEVVLCVKQTHPEPCVEVHCHGGPEVQRMLVDLFVSRGCLVSEWTDLLHRNRSALEADATIALTQARTLRTANVILDQLHGAFANAIHDILHAIENDQKEDAGQRLQSLAKHTQIGRRLTTPWRVAIAGAPNVGKSSLINRLAGYQRAVVSETPGTTRDVVITTLALDGWLIEFQDTAGMRSDAGTLEGMGIELTRSAMTKADLCLWVVDASVSPVMPEEMSASTHVVINKTDLAPTWDLNQYPEASHFSAQTGEGITTLCESITQWLIPDPPTPGDAVPFSSDLCDRVERAWQHWQANELQQARGIISELSKGQ